MSEKELKDTIEGIRKLTKEIVKTNSKDRAIRILASTGMYTRKGKLKKQFQ